MQRITIPWLIDAMATMDAVQTVQPSQKIQDVWFTLYSAKQNLEILFNSSVYAGHLRISRSKFDELSEILNNWTDAQIKPLTYVLSEYDVWKIRNIYEQFKTIFIAELATLPAYLITQKENYDTERLIHSGVGLFPSDMTVKVPETWSDAMECGRCLAFEVNTACGFHTFRAIEAVLRKYWLSIAGDRALPTPATMGNIANQLEMNKLGEQKVWESLRQMAKLHRNPLAHADVILNRDEALSIIGMGRSVLTAMLRYIPVPAMTTELAAPVIPPSPAVTGP